MLRWHAGASTVAPVPPPLAPRPAARGRLRPCRAKKPADDDDDRAGGGSSLLSKSVLLRSGVALFALGFVDAGYSGDWSRIGAISKDTEELLRLGAYGVVPLSLALIFSLSQDSNSNP
ncbi:hypothetical protein GQ55_9G568300 [Panicum hallii var. hallii]|uniref:DUF7887 domain-containing protein n=2 Tax=Panicum hallii TaxID=206008 RepID=A0A2T7CFV8_9POAL|nr:uncharacterized protein LOC112877533 [Panicum hallii]PAN50935.1 hypothetical protein PAHAL_9G558100 [Panicum hallii]PUZ42237.1 hypothetical protein GQ55_9G568300 [Panicum hallii var. hallii]